MFQIQTNIGNNANTRKLREEEQYNSIRAAIYNTEYTKTKAEYVKTKEEYVKRNDEYEKTKIDNEKIITAKDNADKALLPASKSEEAGKKYENYEIMIKNLHILITFCSKRHCVNN